MKSLLLSKVSMLGALVAAMLFVSTVGTAQDASDNCPGCMASASPPVIEPVTQSPMEPCGIRFNFGWVDGSCKKQEPGTSSPCVPAKQCYFDVTAVCLGDCSQWVQGLWDLGGAVIPIFIPCGVTQPLGFTGCGTTVGATVIAYNVVTNATRFSFSTLKCGKCEN